MQREYNASLFFDNLGATPSDELSPFSLEAIARNAAQKMIQAMLAH